PPGRSLFGDPRLAKASWAHRARLKAFFAMVRSTPATWDTGTMRASFTILAAATRSPRWHRRWWICSRSSRRWPAIPPSNARASPSAAGATSARVSLHPSFCAKVSRSPRKTFASVAGCCFPRTKCRGSSESTHRVTLMRKITAWTPLVLTVLGFAGLGSLAVYRLMHMPSAGTQVIGVLFASSYLIWMSRESRISVAEISKPEADHDRGTMELAAVVKILLLIAALAPPSSLLSGRYALAAGIGGMVLVVSGASLRLSAIRALGDSYSHRI